MVLCRGMVLCSCHRLLNLQSLRPVKDAEIPATAITQLAASDSPKKQVELSKANATFHSQQQAQVKPQVVNM